MVKEKPNSIRTYDKEGFRRRAACLCFKDDAEKEILLVTSSKDREKWVVPGGGVEPLEDPRNTAEREALEEAGVRGKLGRHIGMFENKDKNHRTTVYVFVVTELMDDWEDKRAMGLKRTSTVTAPGAFVGKYLGIKSLNRLHIGRYSGRIVSLSNKNLQGRTREWFSIAEAHAKLSHKPIQLHYLRELLEKPLDMVT